MSKLKVEVVTPSASSYKAETEAVTVPGAQGQFQVLYNHAPIMSTLEPGAIKIKENGSEKVFATGGGFVEVKDNRVLILAESFEAPSDIDIDRAKEAEKRARERLSKKSEQKVDEARAEAALKRAINRLKIAPKAL